MDAPFVIPRAVAPAGPPRTLNMPPRAVAPSPGIASESIAIVFP